MLNFVYPALWGKFTLTLTSSSSWLSSSCCFRCPSSSCWNTWNPIIFACQQTVQPHSHSVLYVPVYIPLRQPHVAAFLPLAESSLFDILALPVISQYWHRYWIQQQRCLTTYTHAGKVKVVGLKYAIQCACISITILMHANKLDLAGAGACSYIR